MKKVITPIVLMLALISCSKKDSGTTTTTPQPNIKFTVLGVNYNIDGSLGINASVGTALKRATLENTKAGYEMTVQNGTAFGMALDLMTSTDLSATSYAYTFPSANLPRFGDIYGVGTANQYVAGYGSGDFVTITVSKIVNGYASGTFSAKMTAYNSTTNRVDITGGVFTDILIQN